MIRLPIHTYRPTHTHAFTPQCVHYVRPMQCGWRSTTKPKAHWNEYDENQNKHRLKPMNKKYGQFVACNVFRKSKYLLDVSVWKLEHCVFLFVASSVCRRRHVVVCWLSIIVQLTYTFDVVHSLAHSLTQSFVRSHLPLVGCWLLILT